MQVLHRCTLVSCLRGKVYRLHIGRVFPHLDKQGMVQKESLGVVWGVCDPLVAQVAASCIIASTAGSRIGI